MHISRPQHITFVLFLVLIVPLTACGTMKVREVHYFAVPNGENTNYYRLKGKATSKLGVAEYRAGWFPVRSIDYLFGDVRSNGGAAALDVQSQLEAQINDKILSTNHAWLEEAAKPEADPNKLEGLLRARRRVLAYPSSDTPPYTGAFEIEYNPAKPIHTRYADEKLLFILSSNPDEIIGKITNFSENEKTVLSINQLSQVIAQRVRNDVAAQEATEGVNKGIDSLVLNQIKAARQIAENPETNRDEAIKAIDTFYENHRANTLQPCSVHTPACRRG